VLNDLDKISEGFDELSYGAQQCNKEKMDSALKKLKEQSILPKQKAPKEVQSAVQNYLKLDKNRQEIMPDLVVCMSKLCMYICRAIRESALKITGMVTDPALQS